MKIIAIRPFSSSRIEVGNVSEGQVVNTDDGYAKSLIDAGLAAVYAASPPLRADRQTNFRSPVGVESGSGPSSQAAPASPKPTVTKYKPGARKTKPEKSSS